MPHTTRVTRIAGLVLLCAPLGFPQGKSSSAPAAGAGSIGAPTGSTTSPTTSRFPTSTTNNPTNPTTTMPEMNRPIMISGKVMLSTGTPPPEQVTIQRVCGGRTITEGYTDSKGRFSFSLGERLGVMPDASESNYGGMTRGMGTSSPGGGNTQNLERQLFNCDLQAVLPGYRAQTVSLAGRRSLDNPDVGTIILRRLEGVEGLTISATSALAPKDAKKAYDKGLERMKKGKPEEARAEFQKAVEIYPKYAMAWYYLGQIQEKAGQANEAHESYAQALKADNKLVQPYLQLASMAAKENKWEEVATQTDKLIRLDPVEYPAAYYLNAAANLNLHKLDEAEKSARQGMKVDEARKMPQLNYVLGLALLQKENYEEGTSLLKTYLAQAPNASNADTVKKQIAEAERVSGKTEVTQQQPKKEEQQQ